MTKIRSTKNALISAILVLCMCFTGLLGTTFAWFTDSVTSSGNKIVAGTLKVDLELLDKATGEWKSLKKENDPIFVSEKWEPGHTEVKLLKVENEGNLALNWKTVLTKYSEISELADVIDVYVLAYGVLDDAEASALTYPQGRDLTGYTRVGTAAEFLRTMEATTKGFLEAEQSAYLGLALKMREDADNKYQGMSLGGTFDITVLATQGSFEEDSFDETYDEDSEWPFYSINFTAAESVADKVVNNTLTEEVPVGAADAQVSAVVPSGVKLADGADTLELSVKSMEAPTVDLNLEAGETAKSVDVHIDGVAEDNTVPMLVTLRQLFSKGLNSTSVKLYHVEDGTPVEMTQVALADLDAHNEFSYDPATGDVTMSVASFSEYVPVTNDFNLWKGEFDYSWYVGKSSPYTISSADQLAGFGVIVDGGYYKKDDNGDRVWVKSDYIDDFDGDIVQLGADIDLAGGYSLNPIGYGYVNGTSTSGTSEGKSFEGTFDGQNHVIRNLYQNGWDIGLSYTNAGGGLFASVHNATIQNLTMVNANIVMECVEQGVIAGLAQGNCNFINININGCSVANYQRATGGVVGEVSWGAGEDSVFTHTFRNINIDSTTVIGSLWGDFDAPVGGVIGGYWDDSSRTRVVMDTVNVACRLDVYNDITSSYQWHAYRRAGMLIGNTDRAATTEDRTIASTVLDSGVNYLACTNVNVYYGSWVNYHYCEFNNYNSNWPWVRVEAGENCSAYSNPRWGVPEFDGVKVTPENHTEADHAEGDGHNLERTFNQLYGGGQGVYGTTTHDNVTTSNYDYVVTYMNDGVVLGVDYVDSKNKNADGTFTVGETDAASKAATAAETMMGADFKFDHWMNTGSSKVETVAADNDKDIILYPSFQDIYTATFVDQDGNILDWTTYTASTYSKVTEMATAIEKAGMIPEVENCIFAGWQVRVTDANGNYAYKDFTGNTFAQDITISPLYTLNYADNPNMASISGVDTDGDGKYNHYEVTGYSTTEGTDLVEIPDSINGVPITTIKAGAFAQYDGVHAILIPKSVTTVGGEMLATNWSGWFDSGETVTIYYAGTIQEWYAIRDTFADDWHNGLGEGSRIFFLNGGETVKSGEIYLQASVAKNWQQTVTSIQWNEQSVTEDLVTEYTGTCDCKDCNGADRPDAKYWEGVTVN